MNLKINKNGQEVENHEGLKHGEQSDAIFEKYKDCIIKNIIITPFEGKTMSNFADQDEDDTIVFEIGDEIEKEINNHEVEGVE